jgi:hypothetical protein
MLINYLIKQDKKCVRVGKRKKTLKKVFWLFSFSSSQIREGASNVIIGGDIGCFAQDSPP